MSVLTIVLSSIMAMPSISEIAAASKRKRKDKDVLMASYETLVGIDAVDSGSVRKKRENAGPWQSLA